MASYKAAIQWIAEEDDTDFLDDPCDDSMMSVTASMVADLFNKDHDTVRKDLRKALAKLENAT